MLSDFQRVGLEGVFARATDAPRLGTSQLDAYGTKAPQSRLETAGETPLQLAEAGCGGDSWLLWRCVDALGLQQNPAAERFLVEWVRRDRVQGQFAGSLYRPLGKVGGPAARQELVDAARVSHAAERWDVLRVVLDGLTDTLPGDLPFPTRTLLHACLPLAGKEDVEACSVLAAEALALAGEEAGFAALRALVRGKRGPDAEGLTLRRLENRRLLARQVWPELVAAYQDPRDTTAYNAAYVLL